MPIPLGVLAVAGAGAAGGGSFDLLETTVLGTAAASVTFSSLGSYSDYKHLEIRTVTGHTNSGGSSVIMRFNSDSGNNYARHALAGNGSTVTSSANTSTSNILVGIHTDSTSSIFGASVISIQDFGSSSKNKTARALIGVTTEGIRLVSGFRNNTEAITSITLLDIQGFNFRTGSRFSLYGIK